MKVLSVQQPWASLIVAGIKSIENRTWQPRELPGRILIHASKKCTEKTMDKEPLEWVQEIFNHQTFGNLPDFAKMPSNAIIGYVTVERVDKDNAYSVWAAGDSNDEKLYYWHLTDAYVFDKPITGVNGKLWLWDFDIDEENLPPAHKVKVERVLVNDDNVSVPVKSDIWEELGPNMTLSIELGTVANDICKPEVYSLLDFKTVTFRHKGHQRTFSLLPETESQYYTDGSEDQNPARYLSLREADGAVRWVVYFVWGEEIK